MNKNEYFIDYKENKNPDLVIKNLSKMNVNDKAYLAFMGIILLICILVLLIGWMTTNNNLLPLAALCLGPTLLFLFFFLCNHIKIKNNLKGVNYDEIKEEIKAECIGSSKINTFFTKNYIISNYNDAFAIKYSDIAWIYKIDEWSDDRSYHGASIQIRTIDKKRVKIFYSDEFCNIIVKKNPKVLVGYTNENEILYEEMSRKAN